MRDGAAHVLRCLKVWYDLPSSVLLAALNLMDRYDIFTSLFGNCNVNPISAFRFISRMKARPKHLSCIAISSFHLAALQWVERVNSINNTGNHNENTASTSSTLQVEIYIIIVSQHQIWKFIFIIHYRLQNHKIWS